MNISDESLIFNKTNINSIDDYKNGTQITILYPLVGLSTILMSLGYLFMAIKNYKQSTPDVQEDTNTESNDEQMLNQKQWIILGILIGSFFFYGGAEVLFGTYIATFSVKSLLKLSKQTGSEVFKKLRKLGVK